MAGTRVSLENKITTMGLKKAESCIAIVMREYMPVIWLLSASSTRRQFHEFETTCTVPLTRAAKKKNQKFVACHQMKQGMAQAVKSKIAVVFRLPSLSVIGPPKKAHPTWDNIKTVATNPIWVSFRPIASIYTDVKGTIR